MYEQSGVRRVIHHLVMCKGSGVFGSIQAIQQFFFDAIREDQVVLLFIFVLVLLGLCPIVSVLLLEVPNLDLFIPLLLYVFRGSRIPYCTISRHLYQVSQLGFCGCLSRSL
jgi:hypothetical protein